MARRRSTGLFEAFQLLNLQNDLLANPPQAVKPEPTAQEKRERRERAIVDARATQYQEEQAKAEAESKRAQEAGERDFLLTQLGASRDEKKILADCLLDAIPQRLAAERREAPLRARRTGEFNRLRATPIERAMMAQEHPEDIEERLLEMRRAVIAEEAAKPNLGPYKVLLKR